MNVRIMLMLAALLCFESMEAQLFKKLKKRVGEKIERKVEDKVVEELSEELARRAVKPLDKAFDDMFRASYRDQYGSEYNDTMYADDPEKRDAMMQTILSNMYGNVELPEQYKFAYLIEIEVTDYGEKKSNDLKMLVDPDGKAFGMEQKEGKDEQIMVFDIENDLVVIFNEKEKSAMAVPNVMKMSYAYGQGTVHNVEQKNIKFDKMNKTKKLLGYVSQGYKVETEEDEGEYYVSNELPFNWKDAFGNIVENISPNFYKDNPEYDIDGMMLLSEMKRKSDGKKAKWKVTKIDDKTTTINCSDYKLANMMSGQ